MRFLGSKFTQNALRPGLCPNPAEGAKALPRPLPISGEGKEGGGKGEKGYWGRERRREGKGREEEGKGEGGGKGRRGGDCVIGIRGDRRSWQAL